MTGQMALATALLISAGLFTRSLVNVSRVDLGMDADGLTVFTLSPELSDYTPDESRALFERIEDELSAAPGVTGVTAALVPLLTGSNWGTGVSVEGFERGPDTDANARFNTIGPDYFGTMGVALLAGREFTAPTPSRPPKSRSSTKPSRKNSTSRRIRSGGEWVREAPRKRKHSISRSSGWCPTRSTARSSRTLRPSSSVPTGRTIGSVS